jgi:hypothetical protein
LNIETKHIHKPRLENTQRLESLYKYLNYEIFSSVLYFASWFVGMLLPLLFLLAIVFSPYMLYVLYLEEKKGWIITFVLLIILPAILTLIFFPMIIIVGLAPFYFYCFILRMEVRNWLQEKNARNELTLQKFKKENEKFELDDLGFFIQK